MKTNIGGLDITALTLNQWVNLFFEEHSKGLRNRFYTSANGNVVSQYARNPDLRRAMNRAAGIDADGMSLVKASIFFSHRPIPERVVTTDFFHGLLRDPRAKGLRVFLLGGTTSENERATAICEKLYPESVFCGRNGYFTEGTIPTVLSEISYFSPDIIFVGMGVPREQIFCANNLLNNTRATWIKTCGGMFKVLCGDVKRPPIWIREHGLEWFYRCIKEPRHVLWRYATTSPHAIYQYFKHRQKL